MRERELKLAVGDTFVMPPLVSEETAIAAAAELPGLELGSVYHDTADLRLARHGVTLRYRVGETRGPIWTLKLPIAGHDVTDRDELDFEGGPGSIPAAARNLVAAWVRHAVLQPAVAMSTRRRHWLLSDTEGRAVAELVQDDVWVLDGDRPVARFRELEVESRGPELDALMPIARQLQRAGAVPATPVPKAIRALGARATAAPDVAASVPNDRSSAGDAVRAAIADATRRLVANDARARLGDNEAVHQMRVATRRLRSDLRTFATMVDPGWSVGLAAELRWLGSVLGAVRDRDVELDFLSKMASDLEPHVHPLVDDLLARREEARGVLLSALGDARYLDLLDRLVEASREPMLTGRAGRRARRALPKLARRASRRLVRRATAVDGGATDGDYHRIRIAAKRARYAAEAIAPFVSRPGVFARLAAAAASVQDNLGRIQDAVVLEEDARRVLASREGDAAFAFAAGQLVGRMTGVKAEARAAHGRRHRRLLSAARAAGAVPPR